MHASLTSEIRADAQEMPNAECFLIVLMLSLQVRKPQGNAPVDTPTSDENLESLSKVSRESVRVLAGLH